MRARVISSALAVIAMLICFRGLSESAIAGFSRICTHYAQATKRLDVVNDAVRLTPTDPEAHYARALLLSDAGRTAEAAAEIERATARRPRDFVLWMELGSGREHAGRREPALAAYREAVRLAPYYAQPHWQLGNLLLRMGKREEAFAELHRAATSDPSLLLTAIDLAWAVTGGDTEAVEKAFEPASDEVRLTMARYFAKRGKWSEALKIFQTAGGLSRDDRSNLIKDLLAAKQFKEAYQVWAWSDDSGGRPDHSTLENMTDGGFEQQLRPNEPGFDWQLAQDVPSVHISQETTGRTGHRSLRLEWSGDSNPDAWLLTQLVLIEPNTRYTLSFAARSEEVVTGGLPVVSVADAGDERMLAQSPALPPGTNNWQEYSVSFTTGETTRALLIGVRRFRCNSAPCPAFGRIWFDDFSLTRAT